MNILLMQEKFGQNILISLKRMTTIAAITSFTFSRIFEWFTLIFKSYFKSAVPKVMKSNSKFNKNDQIDK